MLARTFGVLLIAHGVAHVVGFVVAWRLAEFPDVPYETTVFGGRIDLGDRGVRILGVAWLAAAIVFGAAGVGALAAATWWMPTAGCAACFSLAMCTAGWPQARIGLVIDVVILLGLGLWR